jgi:outer membrane protein assembly factor BamB
MTADEVFTALNASNGAARWKVDLATMGGLVTSVAVEQNVVYLVTDQGVISALNAENGALRWCDLAGGQLVSANVPAAPQLVADQERIYVEGGSQGGGSRQVLAFRASDGQQQWQAQAEAGILWLAVAEGQVYVSSEGAAGDLLSAFNASSGKEAWHFQTGNGVFSQPAAANGLVYVTEGNPNFPSFLYALDASTGAQRWHAQEQASDGLSAPHIVSGAVYVLNNQGAYAYDASMGGQRWHHNAPGMANLGPVVDASGFYFASADGSTGQATIYALNLGDGSQRWQAQPVLPALAAGASLAPASSGTGLTVFAAANGVVYLTSYTSTGALNATSGKQVWSASGAALALG